jgi:hypothetical protein
MKKLFLVLVGLMTGSLLGFGQVYNSADLRVENGATLYVETAFDNQLGGDIQNAGTIRVNGDFNNNGDLEVGGKVVLFDGNAQSITGSTRFVGVLEVDKSGSVATVTSGTVEIDSILRLNSGIMNANGNTVIRSTFAGTGLVDDFSDASYDGTLSGNLRVQSYVSGTTPGFHYIGSAVNTANLGNLSGVITLYGPDGGQIIPQPDCDPNNIDASSPYGNLFEWHEDGPWLVPNCEQSGWFVRSSGALTNARGYAAICGSGVFEFSGAEGNTSENSVVAYAGLSNTNLTGDGWHLVSNPFPSPIAWYQAPAGFNSQAQIWQTSGSYSGTYQPILANFSNPTLIASQQGFMVKISSGGGPHTFALPQDYRRLGEPTFYKEDLENAFDIIVEAGGFADKTRVRFGDNGETNGFDEMFDANKLKARGAQPTLKTRMRGVDYSINSLSLEEYPMTVPMDLIPGITGEFKFTAKHLDMFNVEAHVYLEDLKLDKIQELTVNPVYTFFANESDDPERFLLHFRLGEDEPIYTGEDVLMYAHDGSAFIFLPELDGIAQLEVFSSIGSLVHQTSNLNEGKNEINLQGLATGTYILRAMINGKPITKKVIL